MNYQVTDRFGIGLDVISNSDQHLRGDESNQLNTVAGYTLAIFEPAINSVISSKSLRP